MGEMSSRKSLHTVREGECLASIAKSYGFHDWRTVYEHGDNAALRRARPNPSLLLPGDQVAIPPLFEKVAKRPTGQAHRFQIKLARKELALQLRDHDGAPLASEPYELEVDGATPRKGQTDGEGRLRELVPVGSAQARLTVGDRVIELRLGHLEPLREIPDEHLEGVDDRLRNLGYPVGPTKASRAAALALFQADHDLEITGRPDTATIDALEQHHGC